LKKMIFTASVAAALAVTGCAASGNPSHSPATHTTHSSGLPSGVTADQQLCWNPVRTGPLYKHGWTEHWLHALGTQVTQPLRSDEQKEIADGGGQGNAPNSDLTRVLRDCLKVPVPSRWKAYWHKHGMP